MSTPIETAAATLADHMPSTFGVAPLTASNVASAVLASLAQHRDDIRRTVSEAIDAAYTFEGDLDVNVDLLVTDAVLAYLTGEASK